TFIVHPRKRYDGQVFVAFVAGYAVLRSLLEMFRADDRGGVGALSTSQWLGLVLFAAALVVHRRLLARNAGGDSASGESAPRVG
ncbi:MAG TPA: prolipoprotein diacylglyceryl transferase family protein, partial [Polyangiaceae bacterium]|nr:prolipoprotein diacylglyceryl transferase family protein [Polyangiaceae bacterium]